MFGYVKPYVPELKMIENQYYRAAYCGLCRSMREETGFLSRMTLSYDITFLVLIRLAITGELPSFEKKRCFVHPLKKKVSMKNSEALRYSACVSTLLTMHKFEDDVRDEKLPRRLGAFILKSIFSPAYKRARARLSELDISIIKSLEQLHALEKEGIRSADRPAAIFGEMMADIMSFGIEKEDQRLIARSLGSAVGRWIYLIDALDDIDSDRKKKSYNPFLLLFDGALLDNEKKLDMESAMLAVLAKAASAADLIDFGCRRDLEGLIMNILSEGMPRITKRIIFGEDSEKNLLTIENGD